MALACIPTVDCITNQLANGLQLHFGPISLLQVFRTGLLICFSLTVLTNLSQIRTGSVVSLCPLLQLY